MDSFVPRKFGRSEKFFCELFGTAFSKSIFTRKFFPGMHKSLAGSVFVQMSKTSFNLFSTLFITKY